MTRTLARATIVASLLLRGRVTIMPMSSREALRVEGQGDADGLVSARGVRVGMASPPGFVALWQAPFEGTMRRRKIPSG